MIDRVRQYSEQNGTDIAEIIGELIATLPAIDGESLGNDSAHAEEPSDDMDADWEQNLSSHRAQSTWHRNGFRRRGGLQGLPLAKVWFMTVLLDANILGPSAAARRVREAGRGRYTKPECFPWLARARPASSAGPEAPLSGVAAGLR